MNATLPVITDPERVREALTSAPMPAVAPADPPAGLAWLRAHVPRFCDGADHQRRRALVEAELANLSPAALRAQARTTTGPHAHVEVLAKALGLHNISLPAVALVATSYLPYQPDDPAADLAVAELVEACGGIADEATAARICLLVQACHATAALISNAQQLPNTNSAQPESVDDLLARTMVQNSPIRRTRRVVNGELVELDMTHGGLGFGAGPHACPGRAHALALAAGVLEGDK